MANERLGPFGNQMQRTHDVFFVVNRNPVQALPGHPYEGIYLQACGYQVANIREATMYFQRGNAQRLVDRKTTMLTGLVDRAYKTKRERNAHYPKFEIITGQLIVGI